MGNASNNMRDVENPSLEAKAAAGISSAEQLNGLPEIPPRGFPRAVTPPRSPLPQPPKLLLHKHYGPLAAHKWKQNFCSCHDDGPDHIKQWTTVLVCPQTNQLFPSLPYEENSSQEHNGVFWFKTKSAAEHAAAARALAWFKYRERMDNGGDDVQLEPIGSLMPSEECIGFRSVQDLIHTPPLLIEKIEQQLLQQVSSS